MDVKEFVSATLTQIAEGVAEASSAVRSTGGVVNPTMLNNFKMGGDVACLGDTHSGALVFAVDFDVAVTVAAATGTNAGAKLEVAAFLSLGAGGKSSDSTQSTSRVRFRVPMALPLDPSTKAEIEERARAFEERLRRENEKARQLNESRRV